VAVFHFTGHSQRNGLVFEDEMRLDGEWLRDCFGVARGAPYLSFLNACQTAEECLPGGSDLVDAFVEGGAEHVVGTFWTAIDRSSTTLSRRFYSQLRQDATIGQALRYARRPLLSGALWDEAVTGAAFVLYGDPNHNLPRPRAAALHEG
jgi:CHAT domain-containing protein